jgi:glycosyltransferase involved in cell wall biosynthesis
VVIPYHNREEMVFECVESVMLTTPMPCEVVVVDDGSDDADTLKRLQKKYPSLVCLRLPKNVGVASARNRGNSVASGDIIIDLDSDDLAAEGAIEAVMEAIEQGADYVYGDVVKRAGDGAEREDKRPEWRANILLSRGCFLVGMKGYRKSLWGKIRGFDESLPSAVDLDFAVRAEEAGAIFQRVPMVLATYRKHAGQITQAHSQEQNEMARKVIASAKIRRQSV